MAENSRVGAFIAPLVKLLSRRGNVRFGAGFGAGFGELAVFSIICGLTAIMSWAAYSNVQRAGWNNDAAAWAQAAGSIVAIAGAAWLARGEARQARRWRREQGEEAAWSARFVLAQAQLDTQIVAAELMSEHGSFDLFRSWKQRADNVGLALQALLARSDYIHPMVLVTASNAKVLVDHLVSDLDKLEAVADAGEAPSIKLISDIIDVHLNLQDLLDQYDARMRGVRLALDEGNDMLPLRSWKSWPE